MGRAIPAASPRSTRSCGECRSDDGPAGECGESVDDGDDGGLAAAGGVDTDVDRVADWSASPLPGLLAEGLGARGGRRWPRRSDATTRLPVWRSQMEQASSGTENAGAMLRLRSLSTGAHIGPKVISIASLSRWMLVIVRPKRPRRTSHDVADLSEKARKGGISGAL